MSLHPLIGHQEARNRLARAARGGKLPQVLLLTGALGVGKQRLALWLAQLLLPKSGPGALWDVQSLSSGGWALAPRCALDSADREAQGL